jgi:uncharacterized membrane protein YphA (DoxX/SURF4 family)
MRIDAKTVKWLRIVLGIFLIVYALNKFFHFIPSSYGQMPESAQEFLDSAVILLPYLYIFEIIIGLLLIINKWSPAIYIILAPLTIAFLIFSFSNKDFNEMWPALVVAILNFILILSEKTKYKPLFA